MLVALYLAQLRSRLPAAAAAAYTDTLAKRHYSLALVDYARLTFCRFVTDASPASFAAAAAGPRGLNVGVLYRDARAPLRLVARVDALLAGFEAESDGADTLVGQGASGN